MVTILIMSEKMAMLGLLKIELLSNKDFHAIISAHNVTKKIIK